MSCNSGSSYFRSLLINKWCGVHWPCFSNPTDSPFVFENAVTIKRVMPHKSCGIRHVNSLFT